MKPIEAKFDGEKGVRIPMPAGENFRFHLKRGKNAPSASPNTDFLEQLIWLMSEEKDNRLLWCNEDDQWFELDFIPIEKP